MVGIEHIGICSFDTEKLKNWYMEMFGWKQVYDNGKGTYFLKADDGGMIEFVSTQEDGGKLGKPASGIRHVAISVDDLDGMTDKLMSAGVEVVVEKSVSAKGIGTFWFRDPDGNILHLIDRPEDQKL